MSSSEKNDSGMSETTKLVLAALVGAGIGATATWLLTSDKGSQFLSELKDSVKGISEDLDRFASASVPTNEVSEEPKQNNK